MQETEKEQMLGGNVQTRVKYVYKVKNIDTKQSNKRNNENSKSKDKTIT